MTDAKWYVGQAVIVKADRRQPTEVPVARVARKYVYVTQYGREAKFDIQTGVSTSQYGYGDRIYTPEGWVEEQRRVELLEALRAEGLYFHHGESRRSAATLQRLWDALQVEESGK